MDRRRFLVLVTGAPFVAPLLAVHSHESPFQVCKFCPSGRFDGNWPPEFRAKIAAVTAKWHRNCKG